MTYAAQIKTPTLILSDTRDTRVPITQSDAALARLQSSKSSPPRPRLQSLRPATFPRKTVIEAFGKVNAVCDPVARVVAIGG
jgi:hypothetical protein